ncbi:telomere binding protein [Serendipita sp. 401]|nr:telomere binding protein [Serendipita sp. 401]KAG9042645.1 telomere binding protein [Serendipita sp. 407]
MPSYSVTHRYAMLNALALGARELAGLPTPQIALRSSAFPSRILPISAHNKYITAEDEQQIAPIRGLVEGISSQAIDKAQKRVEDKVPEIAREKQLTVFGRRKAGITELQSLSDSKAGASRQPTRTLTFNVIAAEYFIIPITSRFWSYLRESISREEASSRFSQNGGFKATGTGMILSPLILPHFIHTMSVMTHASRHSPAYLAIIAPAVLELALTLGTRKTSMDPSATAEQESKRSASVLSACLELAIVGLDASIDLDEGKTLALEHGLLMSGVSTWAQGTYKLVDSGLRFDGVGGEVEKRLSKASAGLVLKVEEIISKWNQAMIMPF